MKLKGILILMIFIVLCSISTVAADDMNETDFLQIDDSICNPEDENLLEISEVESNATGEVTSDDEFISANGDDQILSSPEAAQAQNGENLYGIVDFGSNTIKLEIYKVTKSGKIKSVIEDSRTSVTAIYCENNTLTQKGIDELMDILDDFEDTMDLVDVKTKFVFATASLRKISNGDEVIAIVKEQFGIDINILSGEKEANLSFNSVKDSELTEDNGIVIDLGGGSCEVIDFVNKTPVSMESMPIGSYSCYADYVNGMFPNETEISDIRNRVLEELEKLEITNATQRYDLYGIGGSIRCIKKVLIYLDYIDSDTTCIPISMLDILLDEFRENTRENYEKILNVNADRVNTFVPGIIITKTIMEYFNISNLHICKNCVREGILMEILENESQDNKTVVIDAYDMARGFNSNYDYQIKLMDGKGNGISNELIEFKIGQNQYYAMTNGEGIATLKIGLNVGTYEVIVSTPLIKKSAAITLNIVKRIQNTKNMNVYYNGNPKYTARIIGDDGKPEASSKSVTVYINSKKYTYKTDSNGLIAIKMDKNMKPGTYAIIIEYGRSIQSNKVVVKHAVSSKKTVKVKKSAKKVTLKVKLKGNNKKKVIKFKIKGKTYKATTNKKGIAKLILKKNKFRKGKNTVKISYFKDTIKTTVKIL